MIPFLKMKRLSERWSFYKEEGKIGSQSKLFEKLTLDLIEADCFKFVKKDYLLDLQKIWWCFLGAICNDGMPGMSAYSKKEKGDKECNSRLSDEHSAISLSDEC